MQAGCERKTVRWVRGHGTLRAAARRGMAPSSPFGCRQAHLTHLGTESQKTVVATGRKKKPLTFVSGNSA